MMDRSQLHTTAGNRCRPVAAGWLPVVVTACLTFGSASAQTPIPYKVIGADGRVTYTDRPVAGDGRAVPVTAGSVGVGGAAGASASTPLPADLRQPVARYPVTLYTVDADCEPCAAARQFLRQRGIPYSERQVLTEEDSLALQRLTGGRDAPTLAIGSQILRGLAPEVWSSYLDAAGYPRDSRLPAGYLYAPATPLVARVPTAATASPAAGAAPPAPVDAPTVPYLPNASGIRF